MTFNEGIRTNPGRGSSSRGRGSGVVAGGVGGLGGLLLLLLYLFLGGDPSTAPIGGTGGGGSAQEQQTDVLKKCQTGADANRYSECRVLATVESLDEVWKGVLPKEAGRNYRQAAFRVFTDAVNTACGAASSATGPFYCPADATVYIDVNFYDALETRLGARNEPLAQEYIVAHEWGHHIQNLTGQLRRVDHRDTGPKSTMVRSELQADCYAGIWVNHAANSIDPETGAAFLQPPNTEQLHDALTAAAAVGDDRIQQQQQGGVSPESWTHGSAEQRMRWFTQGYQHGSMQACDTWSVQQP